MKYLYSMALLTAGVVSFSLVTPALAQTWDGDTSTDFADGDNWVGGVAPAGAGQVIINNITDGTTFAPSLTTYFLADPDGGGGDVFIGGSGGGAEGTLDIDAGGTLDGSGNWIFIGHGGGGTEGTLNLNSGGTLTSNNEIRFGQNSGTANGIFNINDGSTLSVLQVILGPDGTGDVHINNPSGSMSTTDSFQIRNSLATNTMSAGFLDVGAELWVGDGGGNSATLDFSGGQVDTNAWAAVGRNGSTGVLNVSGTADLDVATGNPGQFITIGNDLGAGAGTGTVNQTGTSTVDAPGVYLGEGGSSQGTYNLNGGALTAGYIHVGHNNSTIGNFYVNGGSATFAGDGVVLGALDTSYGYMEMNGGILATTNLYVPSAATSSGDLTLNGGSIFALGNSFNFFGGTTLTVNVAGTTTVNTQGFDVSGNASFTGTAAIVKDGAGTWTMLGDENGWSGNLGILDGAVIVGAGGSNHYSGFVDINPGGGFGVNTVDTDDWITPSNLNFSAGGAGARSLTISYGDAGGGIPDAPIIVTSNLDVADATSITVNISGTNLGSGTYTILDFPPGAGGITGSTTWVVGDTSGYTVTSGPTVVGSEVQITLAPPVAPTPDHLWTWTEAGEYDVSAGRTFVDEIGGFWEISLQGNGGTLTGSEVVLPGSTTGNQPASSIAAYLDMDNGIISASADITIEAWATPLSSKNWQRLFDFGRTVSSHGPGAVTGEIIDDAFPPGATDPWDNLSLTFNDGGDINGQQLEGEWDNGGPMPTVTTAATTPGTQYHYALVVEDTVSGCNVSWYRDGVHQNTQSYGFHLDEIEDVNNWIGRSMYNGGDSNSHMSLNELRIYRSALEPSEISLSYAAGPDFSSGPPPPPVAPVLPVRRWDFNLAAGGVAPGTPFYDAATGEPATLRGNGALLTGTALRIGDTPGPTNGDQNEFNIGSYLDLENGFISQFSDMTIEGWITPDDSNNWQRVWDFGNCTVTHNSVNPGEIVDGGTAPGYYEAYDNIFLSMNNGGNLGQHRFAGKIGGGGEAGEDINLIGSTATATEYHFVMTVLDQAGASGPSGCQMKFYRDGVLYSSVDLPFRLQDLNDFNNWIGRSNWAPDSTSEMTINELRVYDEALTQAEVLASYSGGADTSFGPPVANDDAVTMHNGQKVLIDVVANDTNGPIGSTINITSGPSVGSASVSDGQILYAHDGSLTSPVTIQYEVDGIGGTSNTATVTVTVSSSLRIDNPSIAQPEAPPATDWTLVDAFPGLTFDRPICISQIPGDSNQLYICEQLATIQRIEDVNATTPVKNTFLDLGALVNARPGETLTGGVIFVPELGLLGLAFHPDYDTNGYFYVAYSVELSGTLYQRVSRFSVDGGDSTIADTTSEVVLLEIDDVWENHNGGDLHFGPDGYLYYPAGDGDNSAAGQAQSQKIDDDFFSGMFRLDVDLEPEDYTPADGTGSDDDSLPPNAHPSVVLHSGNPAFEVPIDNPFVHTSLGGDWDGTYNEANYAGALSTVRTEYWATGLRHPWRISFDPVTGDLWAGDVGQGAWEEIDKVVRKGNYGWAYREGSNDFAGNLPPKPAGFTSIDPVAEYPHGGGANQGDSVCGGWVYRGSRFPELYGYYVCCDSVSGNVWQMDTATGTLTRITGLPGAYGVFSAMGTDPSNGDILLCAYNDGRIMRLEKGDTGGDFPQTLSETGLFADLSDLSPQPGLLPYDPNLRFWSDHAAKSRWFGIANGTDVMTWQKEGPWAYPTGAIWVKHFDLALTRGVPATNKRIETRVLVKTDAGVYGVSYEWNDSGTEAYLVDADGVTFDLNINDGGSPVTQTWEIPSRNECLTCHQDRPLSFNTRQLNKTFAINGFAGNQIESLFAGGYLGNIPDATATLPFHVRPDQTSYSLEQRVRSYLDVNCGYCHFDGGPGGGAFDVREGLTLEDTGIIHGPVTVPVDPINDELVVPGNTANSVILSRVAETNGYSRMPFLATNELDQEAISLLTAWIDSGLPDDRLYEDWAAANGVTGGKGGDDDNDGTSNYDEFLYGFDGVSGADPDPISLTGGKLEFTRKAFRFYDLRTSTDPSIPKPLWESWDIPENTEEYGDSDVMESIDTSSLPDAERYFFFEVKEP